MKLITKKLCIEDRAIYSHFTNQGLDYAMVFQRWFKCLFKREFPLPDTCLIWDYLFAHEAEKPSGMLLYIDYIVMAMIINVKYNLLSRDSNGIFQVFLNYPKISPITNLFTMADRLAENEATIPTQQISKTDTEKKDEKEKPKIEQTNQSMPQTTTQPSTFNTTINNPIPNPLLLVL